MDILRIVQGVGATLGVKRLCALGCSCADKDEEDKCEDCKTSGMG